MAHTKKSWGFLGSESFRFGKLDREQDLTEVMDDEPRRGTFWEDDCVVCRGTGARLLRGVPDYSQKCPVCRGSGKK